MVIWATLELEPLRRKGRGENLWVTSERERKVVKSVIFCSPSAALIFTIIDESSQVNMLFVHIGHHADSMGWIQMSCKHIVVGVKTSSQNQVCRLAMSSSRWRFHSNQTPHWTVLSTEEVKFQLQHETKTDPHLLKEPECHSKVSQVILDGRGGHSGSAPASSHVCGTYFVSSNTPAHQTLGSDQHSSRY